MRTAFAASLVCAAALGVSAAPGLTVTVTVPPQVNGVDNLSATTLVTNTGTEPLKILNTPNSPLSSAKTRTFAITNGSGSPAFTGMLVKYSPALAAKSNNPADFTVLQPGESREVTHDLAGVYNFKNVGPGEFKISSNNIFQHVDGSGALQTITATANPATFGISGNLVTSKVLRRRQPRLIGRQNSPQYLNCGDAQQAQVLAGVEGAEVYANEAVTYLNQVTQNTDRYTTWFGEYEETRARTVTSHFQAILGEPSKSTYDCAPTECGGAGTFAYVYPTQPGTVYLCDAFWNAPETGTDSMAGTIIHEHTHFDIYGGTRDHAYGQQACKDLANQDPETAIANADSHEYFAENNPAQS